MNQKQKDTIREEFEKKITESAFTKYDENVDDEIISIKLISDFWLNKLDQAVKDKVEEVEKKLEKSLEDLDSRIPYEEGTKEGIMHAIHLLKDNT
jgi:hypothetical protein